MPPSLGAGSIMCPSTTHPQLPPLQYILSKSACGYQRLGNTQQAFALWILQLLALSFCPLWVFRSISPPYFFLLKSNCKPCRVKAIFMLRAGTAPHVMDASLALIMLLTAKTFPTSKPCLRNHRRSVSCQMQDKKTAGHHEASRQSALL